SHRRHGSWQRRRALQLFRSRFLRRGAGRRSGIHDYRHYRQPPEACDVRLRRSAGTPSTRDYPRTGRFDMIISTTAFTWLVGIALVLTMAAPIILLTLLVRDSKKGQLW